MSKRGEEPDLLDLLQQQAHDVDPRRDWNHLCMPNMAYACGGNIVDGLPDGGPRGHQSIGGWGTAARWAAITCPDCRADGPRETGKRAHLQTTPHPHECSDACHWTTLPEKF